MLWNVGAVFYVIDLGVVIVKFKDLSSFAPIRHILMFAYKGSEDPGS